MAPYNFLLGSYLKLLEILSVALGVFTGQQNGTPTQGAAEEEVDLRDLRMHAGWPAGKIADTKIALRIKIEPNGELAGDSSADLLTPDLRAQTLEPEVVGRHSRDLTYIFLLSRYFHFPKSM